MFRNLSRKYARILGSILICLALFAVEPFVFAQTATSASVTALAWNSNGTRIAIGHQDGTVSVQYVVTREELLLLTAHTYRIEALAWSPDDLHLASGSGDNTIRIWNSGSGQILAELHETGGRLITIAWSFDGSRLASASEGGDEHALHIWNPQAGQMLGSYTGIHPISIAWSPDGKKLACALAAGAIKIIDTTTFDYHTAINLFTQGKIAVYSVSWSRDGTKLVSGEVDGSVTICNAVTNQQLFVLSGSNVQNPQGFYDATIRAAHFNADGSRVGSISQDGIIRIWDTSTGQAISTLSTGKKVYIAAWSPDGSKIAYTDLSGSTQIIQTPQLAQTHIPTPRATVVTLTPTNTEASIPTP